MLPSSGNLGSALCLTVCCLYVAEGKSSSQSALYVLSQACSSLNLQNDVHFQTVQHKTNAPNPDMHVKAIYFTSVGTP